MRYVADWVRALAVRLPFAVARLELPLPVAAVSRFEPRELSLSVSVSEILASLIVLVVVVEILV